MNLTARGLAALLASTAAVAFAAPPAAKAPTKAPAKPAAAASATSQITAQSLATPRQKASYVVAFDLSQMLMPIAPDLDIATFRATVDDVVAGKAPQVDREKAAQINKALMQRIAARRGQPTQGPVPEVSKTEVARLVAADLGPSLAGIKNEVDFPIVFQALSGLLAGQQPVLDEATRNSVRTEFTTAMKAKMEAKRSAQAGTNKEAGEKFLAENRTKKGVFSTPSGLQYMVLRQGSGARPKPTDRVRVNYEGKLLDGTVFDSSYKNGQPVEFMLNQVIPGWTEGVSMMPVGAKYRFWIPSQLAYGEKGAGEQIGPNSALTFDVELLAISP
ncbi:FKBP-type peptidyl-prolyl cis-trans isomerase [Lysobacter sp. TY2-98]|uniref:FKBP-type peptidyl-prolyl cis-trans isomerase n=1 Tax=Lysobacter sp. TY2-98 TaxID=2290922 RepID=UPI000E20B7B9|nr:FKBP-type peptidyl-prolyl cis-trans isomerase [Lysobacter sp. TY2-98]AXK71870.1 FKBP-type peptidyl-prolyl cis-trans isomerase [Lysobacter sp. TY2-98]